MISKESLMDHEVLWSFIRMADRHFEAVKADKNVYLKSNRIKKKSYMHYKSYYDNKKKSIIDEIKAYSENMEKIPVDAGVYGKEKLDNIVMLSNNGDQMGKVFSYEGEIYRGIYRKSAPDFIKLWNKGIFQVLWTHEYIPELEFSKYYSEEFPLIIKTKKVTIQKNMVWTYAMVKDACILIAFLQSVLREFDCTLLDGHLNNLTYHNGKPLFVDIGSIIPFRHTAALEEMVFCGLFRLIFGYMGNCMLYRMPVYDMSSGTAFVAPRYYNQLTRDYRHCLKKFKTYHLLHGNFMSRKLVFKVFELYNVKPEDIEVLFPTLPPGETKDIKIDPQISSALKGLTWDKTIVDVGGGLEYIEYFIKNNFNLRKISFLDYDERRLDSVYQKLKEDSICADISLINFIYIQSDWDMKGINADVVLCVSPFSNSKSYQGMNISTIAYQLNLVGNEVIIIWDEESKQSPEEMKDSLYTELEQYYNMEKIYGSDNSCTVWKGTRR